jgi:hypothetical protein
MIVGIWGDDKTCKSTLALSFPKPIAAMELDIGGLERAIRNDTRYGYKAMVKSGDIILQYKNVKGITHDLKYVMPYQAGDLDLATSTIKVNKRITGVKELWYRFLGNYIVLLEDPKIKSILIDTGTLLWEMDATSFLQEVQEKNPDKPRSSLLAIEYREPNIRMRAIIYQAKARGKNLILTHHSRDEYGAQLVKGEMVEAKTGKKERSGWGPLGDGADLIVHTYLKDEPILDDKGKSTGKKTKVPYCSVDLAEILDLVGMEFRCPTYQDIEDTLTMMRGE